MNINKSENIDFMDFVNLFNLPSKQKSIPNSSPEMHIKLGITQLTSILTESDSTFGKKLLDCISSTFLQLLILIQDSDNPLDKLSELINIFNSNSPQKPISASRTAMQEHIPSLSKSELDDRLSVDYQEQMRIRQENNAKSREITLAIDYSHESSTSKYINNQHSWIRIGQRKTWERGFNYSGIYDTTHQMFVGFIHHNKHKVKRDRRRLQPWIEHLQKKIGIVQRTGTKVTLIEADRGYFDAEFFALSHLGLLRGFGNPRDFLRIIVPRKFTAKKDDTKWKYLISRDSNQVSCQSIQLNFYSHEKLLKACENAEVLKKDGYYHIPVTQVVLVDEYGQKSKRSYEKLCQQARLVDKELILIREKLKCAEQEYLDFKSTGKKPKKKLKWNKGRRRSRFKSDIEKMLYTKCFKLYDRLKSLKEQKEEILHATAFFYISIAPNEDVCRYPEKFIKYAIDYHERWGIENGFRDVKYNFLQKSRSQRSTRRQFYWLLGLKLYNRWQTRKCLDLLQKKRNQVYNIVPWDSRRPHVRQKLEQEINTKWSAKFYLLSLWKTGLELCIKSI